MSWGPPARRWTSEEDERLAFEWGSLDLQKLADKFGRTMGALTSRAQRLKLGAPSRRTRTMDELVRLMGYARTRIETAAQRLGIRLNRGRRSDPRQKQFTFDYAITVEQAKAIKAFLEEHAGVPRLYKTVGKRTERGVWGVGIKPKCCVECGRKDKPHYARGKCQRCYMHQIKTGRKKSDPWKQVEKPDPWASRK